jgi:hypothetical protein
MKWIYDQVPLCNSKTIPLLELLYFCNRIFVEYSLGIEIYWGPCPGILGYLKLEHSATILNLACTVPHPHRTMVNSIFSISLAYMLCVSLGNDKLICQFLCLLNAGSEEGRTVQHKWNHILTYPGLILWIPGCLSSHSAGFFC